MIKYRIVSLALAGIVLSAVMAAPAGAATARGTLPRSAATVPSASGRSGPDAGEFVKDVGTTVIRNQGALSTFRAWMIGQPGFARSGYVGSIDNLARKAMTIMWYGPRTPLLAAILQEGARRGIAVTIQHRKYSLQQIEATTAAILKQAAAGKWAGFKISAIAGVSAADDGIIVDGTYTAVPAARRAPQVRSLATVVNGVAVRVAPGHPVTPTGSRDADTAPFNSGGFMLGYYTKDGCSSGFAIKINGVNHTITARHCVSSHNGVYDFVDANDAYAPSPPPTNQWYGNSVGTSADGGARILGNTGFEWMFNQGWYSQSVSTVIGLGDVGINDLTCTEGGNSGEHCNVKVTNLVVSWNDGYGWFSTIQATQQTNGDIAVMKGDSGGPVMLLGNGSPTLVRAAGMIQAQGDPLASCPQSFRADQCSKTVLFTSMRTIVDSVLGASLVTNTNN
jgi:hypothetical protein